MQFLQVGFGAFSYCPAIHKLLGEEAVIIMRFRRPELAVLRPPGNKSMLGCSSQTWALVLSGLSQQLTSVLGWGGYEYHVIQKIWTHGPWMHLIANTGSQEVSPGGQIPCKSQAWYFFSTLALSVGLTSHQGCRACDHCAFCHGSSLPLEIICGTRYTITSISHPDTLTGCHETC
jgi:hypothetical protein